MPNRDIVVVGASAGGVPTLKELVSLLPPDFAAAIFIVQHMSPGAQSLLPQILARSGPLPALSPEDLEVFRPGHIYVARPDHHLLREGEHVRAGQQIASMGSGAGRDAVLHFEIRRNGTAVDPLAILPTP